MAGVETGLLGGRTRGDGADIGSWIFVFVISFVMSLSPHLCDEFSTRDTITVVP